MIILVGTVVSNGRPKNNTHKTFHILKMKAHFEKNHILKMKAHSETHFENENMFLEKWKVSDLFFTCQQSTSNQIHP